MQTLSLFDKKYTGGLYSGQGHNFETTYILNKLPEWLTQPDLEGFQQEVWSDIDLYFTNGEREFIQIKKSRITPTLFLEILQDFQNIHARKSITPNSYENFTLACLTLSDDLSQLDNQLKRFRAIAHLPESEISETKKELLSKIASLNLSHVSSFILEKVYFDSNLGYLEDEHKIRALFIGSLVDQYEVEIKGAKDIYLHTARLIETQLGHKVPLAIIRMMISQKRLEHLAQTLTSFDLINETFLQRHQNNLKPSDFFNGARPTWMDIAHDRDVVRDIMPDILSKVIEWEQGNCLVPVLAEGGAGKSTFLQRLAVELSKQSKVVLYHRRDQSTINSKEVEQIAQIAGKKVHIFADDVTRIRNFDLFIESLADIQHTVILFAGSRPYEWKQSNLSRANIHIEYFTPNNNYPLNSFSDNEAKLLSELLTRQNIINPLSTKDTIIIRDFYNNPVNRRFSILVFILTKGEEIEKVIQKEINHVEKMGTEVYKAYRYICLMTSVQSYVTIGMLKALVSVDSVKREILAKLDGLIEIMDEKIYARHDRVGEIATKIMFADDEDEYGEVLCTLISTAFDEKQVTAVENILDVLVETTPSSQKFKVVNHLVDEAYCANELQIMKNFIMEFIWNFNNKDTFSKLLISKTPLLWEQIIFPLPQKGISMEWKKLQAKYGVSFLWPKCFAQGKYALTSDFSIKTVFDWGEFFSMAIYSSEWEHTNFLFEILEAIYTNLIHFYPSDKADIYYKYAHSLQYNSRDQEAIKWYTLALEINPIHDETHAGLAISLYNTDEYTLALYHYKTARSLNPEIISNMNFFGFFEDILGEMGELEELIECKKYSLKSYSYVIRDTSTLIDEHINEEHSILATWGLDERWRQKDSMMNEIENSDYSEEAESKQIAILDGLLQFVKDNPELYDEIGEKIFGKRWKSALKE